VIHQSGDTPEETAAKMLAAAFTQSANTSAWPAGKKPIVVRAAIRLNSIIQNRALGLRDEIDLVELYQKAVRNAVFHSTKVQGRDADLQPTKVLKRLFVRPAPPHKGLKVFELLRRVGWSIRKSPLSERALSCNRPRHNDG
jgi:hypothetical protein